MRLLIDTQALVWLLSGDRRLRKAWVAALADPDATACVSAVTAWEYSDLRHKGRLPVQEDLADLQALFGIELVDFPAECWMLATDFPDIHGDPIDRMVVAHAIVGGFTLITSDRMMRRYPMVKTLW